MDDVCKNRSGWLKIQESGVKEVLTRWCILDNGVLWLQRRPGELEGRDVLPLHDAVVGECDPPTPLQIAVRCRRSGRVLALTAMTREDFNAWMSALTITAREWREKRRSSVLNRQLINLVAENDKNDIAELGENLDDIQFKPRRRSEVPRPTVLPRAAPWSGGDVRSEDKHRPLRDIVLHGRTQGKLRWASLHEVKESGLLGLLSDEQKALEELKFAVIVEEIRFNAELASLHRLATRAVSWKDTQLTPFHKRSIVASIAKVKKSSDTVLKLAEKHWLQRVTLHSALFTFLGPEARAAGWSESYTEYCVYLAELRDLLTRAARDRGEVAAAALSSRYARLELAMVPIQHLTTLRQLLQTLFELLPAGATEQQAARQARDFLNEILDSCYQELTEQSGSEYVAEMDNTLQFDLSSVAPVPGPQLLYKRRQTPQRENEDLMPEEEKQIADKNSKKKSRKSIFNSTPFKTAAQFLRRRTGEGLALKHARTASLPAILFESPQQISLDSESDESSEEETVSDDQEEQLSNNEVPRFFCNEPLYQEYCISVAQDLTERATPRSDEDDETILRSTSSLPYRTCSKWSDHPRVQDTGLLGEMSSERTRLCEAKFEVIASEASYLRSLRLLESHFAHCPEFYDEEVLSTENRHLLFSSIDSHRTCCERLLRTLELCWENDVFLGELCQAIHKNVTSTYSKIAAIACYNQMLIANTLNTLNERPQFLSVLTLLEASSTCQGFTLLSFLSLPQRHLGRLKLLLENIASLMSKVPEVKIEERAACESGRDAVCRLIARADTAASRAKSDVILQDLSQRVTFRRVPRLALSAEGRGLIHQGTWRVLARREDARGPMRAKSPYSELQVILMTDLLLLAIADGSGLLAVDYCGSSELQLRSAGPGGEEPLPGFLAGDEAARNSLYVCFPSQTGKVLEMIVWCDGASGKARWLASVGETTLLPPSPIRPQPALLKVLKAHEPSLPDEARIALGDVVAVIRNPGEGWVLVRSLVDGSRGWLPSQKTVQLSSAGQKSVTFLLNPRFSLA